MTTPPRAKYGYCSGMTTVVPAVGDTELMTRLLVADYLERHK